MKDNPINKPKRTNFYTLLNPAFIQSFSAKNIKNLFKKRGIYPLDYNAIPPEALKPSQLTNKKEHLPELHNGQSTISTNKSAILLVPVNTLKVSKQNKRDSSAKCLTLSDEPLPSCSKTNNFNKITKKSKADNVEPYKMIKKNYNSNILHSKKKKI
jgi:hypothetical protein